MTDDEIPKRLFEQALYELEELGRLQPCRGGFWRTLERAAESLGLPEAQARCHAQYRQTLRALVAQQRGNS